MEAKILIICFKQGLELKYYSLVHAGYYTNVVMS